MTQHSHTAQRFLPLRAGMERGFSLIEVIIAMTILSIVISGAAFAVVSGDSAQVRTEAVADSHAIAEKAVERLRTDLTARSECDSGAGWQSTARAAKLSTSTAAPTFQVCIKEYDEMRDAKGRRYLVDLAIQPIDGPGDGTGSSDSDGNLRDRYEVITSVELAADSKAGREDQEPVEVSGNVDWKGGSTDLGTVRVIACGIDRKDFSLVAGGCESGNNPSRASLPITVSLRGISEESGGATGSNWTVSSGAAPAAISPGAYDVQAPATFSYDGSTFTMMKIDAQRLRIAASQDYVIHATYVRGASTVSVCTQIGNWTGPYDDGYEVSGTNIHYRRTNNAGYRTDRLAINANRSWNCSTVLKDTIDSGSNWYRGLYDLEVEQAWSTTLGASMWGLQVQGVTWNCSPGLAWNQPLDGTALAGRAYDATLDRDPAGDENTAPSRYYRAQLNAGGSHRICIRFYDRQLTRERCVQNPNGTWPADCFKTGTECQQYCPSGARACFQNCARNEAAALSYPLQGQAAKPFGGPADPTVGCRPRPGYAWYGWNPAVILEGKVGQQATWAQMTGYEWVGGGPYYYGSGYWDGRYNSGPIFYCYDVSFAASWQYLCHQGTNTPVYAPGFIECRYRYGDCIQAELPGYPGVFVRGFMRDMSLNYTQPIIPSINAMRSLAFLNGMNRPELTNGWDPGTWWTSLDLRIAVVGTGYSCDWNYDSGKGYRWFNPVIVDVYMRIVNRPDINNPVDRAGLGNLRSDKAGV